MKKQIQKSMALVLAGMLAVACVFTLHPTASAVAYQGKGTQNDPYLVETAAQLDGMRNNLKAHYKLANTIDMSSFGTFTPIGYQGEKFTGSFVCDTNSDGTPKYAIKNLKVYIDAGEKYGHKIGVASSYVDYVEGKNKWQAGLFGYINGATIKNIALLNADVTNTVVGQNSMNPDWSTNPGQNSTDQSAGILVGSAENSTITGCMSSGKMNAKNNNTGGLIGYTVGGSVSNCYSTAAVTSAGYWGTGGLIGICDTDVSNCFATGNVQGGPKEATTGGLIGQVTEGSTSMVISCYSTGNVSPTTNGFSMVGYRVTFSAYADNIKERTQNMLNCYTTGNVQGYKSVQTGDTVIDNNNYILSSSTGRQDCFKAATMAEIKSALAACADYDVSGDAPVLKNVAVITDAGKYVPGKLSETAQNNNDTAAQGSSQQGSGNNTQTGSNTQAGGDAQTGSVADGAPGASAEEVAELIEALPQALEFKLEDKDLIKEAKAAYDALDADGKAAISSELQAKLNDVYTSAVPVIMKQMAKDINALPDIEDLKASDYDTVMAIYDDYNFLSDSAREILQDKLEKKLLDAVEKVRELKEMPASGGITTLEYLVIALLGLLILGVLAFNIVWSVWIIRKNKALSARLAETENADPASFDVSEL